MGYNGVGCDQLELLRQGKRRCPSCKRILPVTDFHPAKNAKSSFQVNCKICAYSLTKKSRQKLNPMERWATNVANRKCSASKKQGVPCNLTKTYLKRIFPKDNTCPVLGIKLEFSCGRKGPADNSPTVDRIDPSAGYVRNNVCIISQRANRLKNDATVDEVRKILDWYSNQFKNIPQSLQASS